MSEHKIRFCQTLSFIIMSCVQHYDFTQFEKDTPTYFDVDSPQVDPMNESQCSEDQLIKHSSCCFTALKGLF